MFEIRRVDLDYVKAGSKLARNIINPNGTMLLSQGTILTDKFIERLKNLNYTSVYIDDGYIDDVVVDEIISEKTRSQALHCIQAAARDIAHHRVIKVPSVKKVVSEIIEDLIRNQEMMLSLSDISSYDDYTFNHSINVTVVSVMIGMCLFYSQEKLRDLGLGVLLHDIGKTQIPSEILTKPAKLTKEEYEIIKKHTWHGFEILRANPEIKITSAHVALQHHERYDGSGYPRRLKGRRILEFARIASIADVYDALSNDRCYRRKLPAHEVYEHLLTQTGIHFDSNILDRFIQKIALYPQGTKVRLNDGKTGYVIKQNSMSPERPLVRLFWHHERELPRPEEINLLYSPTLNIIEVLE